MGTPGVLDLHFVVINGVMCVAGSIEKGGYDGSAFQGRWAKDAWPYLPNDMTHSSLVGGRYTLDVTEFIQHMRERAEHQARLRATGEL